MEIIFAIEKKLRFKKPITIQTAASMYTTGRSRENLRKPLHRRLFLTADKLFARFVSI